MCNCVYFREFQSKYSSLLCSLGYSSLVTGTPDYTWLTSSQGDVLSKLRSYWLPRFMIGKSTRRLVCVCARVRVRVCVCKTVL